MRKRYFLYYDKSLFVPRRNEDKIKGISSFGRKCTIKTILSILIRKKTINFILLYNKKNKKLYYLNSNKINFEDIKEEKIPEFKAKYRADNAKIMEIKDMFHLKDFMK